MQYLAQHQQLYQKCNDCLFWGFVMIGKACATILQNLVFVLPSVLGFVAEGGSGRVKAVRFHKMHSKMQNSAEAVSR